MLIYRIVFVLIILILCSELGFTQTDSLIFKNGDVMVGEIKSMDRGTVLIETEYSDKDFEVEWEDIKKIYTQTQFLVTLSNGNKHYGKLTTNDDLKVQIITKTSNTYESRIENIVFLSPIEERFIDRVSASIDIGFDMTKSQNLRSLSSRSFIGYQANKWSTDATFNNLRSRQDDVEDIIRTEAELNYRHILPKRFYPGLFIKR